MTRKWHLSRYCLFCIAILLFVAGINEEAVLTGADINAKGNDGRTALMQAVMWGQTETVKVLLAKGADVNAKTSLGQMPRPWDTPASRT